jgi:hypothetical protein
MNEEQAVPEKPADALREDLGREYEAIMKVVPEFDGRLMIVKGWSVTLSLAALGLGFEKGHYALFGLAAASALAFWFVDALTKRHQMQYYSRMRDIEVAAFHLNHLKLDNQLVSAPKVDWWWGFKGQGGNFKSDVPARRDPANVRRLLARAPWMPNVFLPRRSAGARDHVVCPGCAERPRIRPNAAISQLPTRSRFGCGNVDSRHHNFAPWAAFRLGVLLAEPGRSGRRPCRL